VQEQECRADDSQPFVCLVTCMTALCGCKLQLNDYVPFPGSMVGLTAQSARPPRGPRLQARTLQQVPPTQLQAQALQRACLSHKAGPHPLQRQCCLQASHKALWGVRLLQAAMHLPSPDSLVQSKHAVRWLLAYKIHKAIEFPGVAVPHLSGCCQQYSHTFLLLHCSWGSPLAGPGSAGRRQGRCTAGWCGRGAACSHRARSFPAARHGSRRCRLWRGRAGLGPRSCSSSCRGHRTIWYSSNNCTDTAPASDGTAAKRGSAPAAGGVPTPQSGPQTAGAHALHTCLQHAAASHFTSFCRSLQLSTGTVDSCPSTACCAPPAGLV
jgi:hypothetical protein